LPVEVEEAGSDVAGGLYHAFGVAGPDFPGLGSKFGNEVVVAGTQADAGCVGAYGAGEGPGCCELSELGVILNGVELGR
jgi:hypothetical protein